MIEGILKLDFFKKLFKNKIGLCIGAGFLGIALIFISSLPTAHDNKTSQKNEASGLTTSEYCKYLEEKVKKIVESITGSKNPVVVVTLDTGVQYVYADNTKNETQKSEDNSKTEQKGTNEQNYIIVTKENGDEEPLVITEYMPTVRGVAIVCEGGYNEALSEKIKNAVMSALNITSKRIYVTGK